jgi:dephospho-CoA kinase
MKSAIIAITGMPGTGKALVSAIAKELDLPIYILGDVIRNEAKSRGLQPSGENLGKLMLELREREGKGVVARRLIPIIKKKRNKFVVVEGVRSLEEVKEFRVFFNVLILGIHSSPTQRFRRLINRGRSDDPKNWNDFVERDERELKVGLGDVIALSDIMILNDSTINRFKSKINSLLKGLISSKIKFE